MAVTARTKIWIGAVGVFAAARLVDAALVGSAVAAALGSVAFAGYMLMQADHPPSVNGLEYLAIFAKPHGAARPAADEPAVVAKVFSPDKIDPAPVGAIGAVAPDGFKGYAIVAAQSGFAWVREGERIFAVRPGDNVAGLGRVSGIMLRQGRWTLVGDGGAALLSSAEGAQVADPKGHAPFSRQMIFGDGG